MALPLTEASVEGESLLRLEHVHAVVRRVVPPTCLPISPVFTEGS